MLKRPENEAANQLIPYEFPVLDHGFVRLVDYMGTDACIDQAARVSYGSEARSDADRRNLLRYMRRHRHTSPTEMAILKFHCKMPIFVARQWIRTRTASVNEQSGRYQLLAQEFYTPENWRLQSATNKQGSSEQELRSWEKTHGDADYKHAVRCAFETYEWLNEHEVSRELARLVLPVSTYTQWYWKIDLHNLLHFLSLRFEPHAQKEIQDYARVIAGMVARAFPLSWEAFVDYQMQACTFSRMEMDLLRQVLETKSFSDGTEWLTGKMVSHNSTEIVERKDFTGSDREWTELLAKFEPPAPLDVSLPWERARIVEPGA